MILLFIFWKSQKERKNCKYLMSSAWSLHSTLVYIPVSRYTLYTIINEKNTDFFTVDVQHTVVMVYFANIKFVVFMLHCTWHYFGQLNWKTLKIKKPLKNYKCQVQERSLYLNQNSWNIPVFLIVFYIRWNLKMLL